MSTDEVGVVRPVGAEFEFEDEARGYADGEIDTEQAHPEFRRAFPEGIARAVVDGSMIAQMMLNPA